MCPSQFPNHTILKLNYRTANTPYHSHSHSTKSKLSTAATKKKRKIEFSMLKGRRVAGKGEAMAANYAFGPHEDDAIIKHRLLTRTTTTRGEPPLKKLQKKISAFVSEIEKNGDNYNECERLAKGFLQELTTFEIPLLKSKAVVDANLREKEHFNELKDEINSQTLQVQTEIEDLKKELEASKIERKHKEECETIRKLIATQPPRSDTEKTIAELGREISELEAEEMASTRLLELRKKQFALLLNVVDELQVTLEDEQRSLVEEMKNHSEEQKVGPDDTSASAEAMNIN